jgi:hypothetical protein
MQPDTNNRHSSNSAEWFTPPAVIEAARATMGVIDLDPASSEAAQKLVRAGMYHTIGDNGFTRRWDTGSSTPAGACPLRPSCVLLNPPGGKCDVFGLRVEKGETERKARSSAKAWWYKLAREFVEGRVNKAVFIGFSIEILQMTQVIDADSEVTLPTPLDFALCFPRTRLSFLQEVESPLGGKVNMPVPGNTHASVIVYLVRSIGRKFDRASHTLSLAEELGKFREHFSPIGRVLTSHAPEWLERNGML